MCPYLIYVMDGKINGVKFNVYKEIQLQYKLLIFKILFLSLFTTQTLKTTNVSHAQTFMDHTI